MADQSNEMGMVEKVARAICLVALQRTDTADDNDVVLGAERWTYWADEARAAIEAVKSDGPVAWGHPTAWWAHADREQVANHCFRGREEPIPLYAIPLRAALSHDEVKG